MDTENRFGLKKSKAIALFFQMILIILATLCTGYVLVFGIINNAGALFVTAYCVVLISYVAVIFYATYGYRKDDPFFLGAIYAFCAAILLNILLPFRTTYQLVTLTLLFGLYIAFAQRLKNIKTANVLMICMVIFAVAFSVYSTITAKTENMNNISGSFFSISAMYISIWTPVIMTVTIGLSYSERRKKQLQATTSENTKK